MTKIVLVVLIVVVGGVIGWLHWSPRRAANQLREAALAGDSVTMNRLVDFESVQKQLRKDLGLEVGMFSMFQPRRARQPSLDSAGFTTFLLVNGAKGVKQLASPMGFTMLMLTGQPSIGGGTGNVSVRSGYEKYPEIFVATVHSAERAPGDTVNLVWYRRGLSWKVEQLRVPGFPESNESGARVD
jgi:hypothetical protein